MMTTLYLDRKGLELRLDGAALALYESGSRTRTVPLALLDRVVIRAETLLTSSVLGALAESGCAVVVLSGRHGRRLAVVLGRAHNDAALRVAQYARTQDADWRRTWAGRFVGAKIARQRRFLACALTARPDCHKPISLGFHTRNRRPPRDPVNACLSLGYTLAHFEAVRAAHAAGLDPFLGFFHEIAFGRESLACDLIEPLRPRVDAWVWEMFRSRGLRAEHFTLDKGACLLEKTGRARFYERFEQFLDSAGRRLRGYCQLLARALRAQAPDLPAVAEEEL
jgi:CRISPR-associated protein Cas1